MGYPMEYDRVLSRNALHGDYGESSYGSPTNIAGDLRRLEKDQRDLYHLTKYAEFAGITLDQAKAVLDALFDGFPRQFTSEFEKRHPAYHSEFMDDCTNSHGFEYSAPKEYQPSEQRRDESDLSVDPDDLPL